MMEVVKRNETRNIKVLTTQILQTLAKTGLPSRSKISDLGLGACAECVLFNEVPCITTDAFG